MSKQLPKDPRRIAFWSDDLKLSDIIHLSALFSLAAEIYPFTRIDLIAPASILDFFNNHDSIDRTINYTDDANYSNSKSYAKQFSKRLITQKYDMIFFISNDSNHIYSAKKAGIPHLIGIKSGIGSSGLTIVIPRLDVSEGEGMHQIEEFLNLLSFSEDVPTDRKTSLSPAPYLKDLVNELLKQKRISVKKPRIIVCPGNYEEGYDSLPDWFSDTVNKAQKKIKDSIVLVVGLAQDSELCEKFTDEYKGKIYNLCGMTDDKMLASLVSASKIVMGIDSVTMLLADSLGTAFAAVYGHREPEYCGPINKPDSCLYIKNWKKRINNAGEWQKYFEIVKNALKESKKATGKKTKKPASGKTSKSKRK